MMSFVRISTLCLKQWVVFTIFVPDRKYIHPQLKNFFNVALKEENSTIWDKFTNRRKFSHHLIVRVWVVENVQDNH